MTPIATETKRQGHLVAGEHVRYIPGHQNRKSPIEYVVDEETGCWIWQGSNTKLGYGRVSLRSDGFQAHRLIYERHYGPIPAGMELDHLCRNPSCVNPAHLEPVTHAENVRRGKMTKLTAQQVAEIRAIGRAMLQRDIAEQFGVSVGTISNILTGHTWRD